MIIAIEHSREFYTDSLINLLRYRQNWWLDALDYKAVTSRDLRMSARSHDVPDRRSAKKT
ncbi:MAG: hypothetical protein ACI82A_002432 [Candidatus Azotimanducaceae bacterium]|jgi:hypothetical protein